MHPDIETFLKGLPENQPLTYKAVYPRRIVPPTGYLNPRYFSVSLWNEIRTGLVSEMDMLPHVTGVANVLMHLEYKVPTFFVQSEFAQAVAQTAPPEDFKFSEIKWPLPAMLFVLPTAFVLRYFGFMCPFLSITNPKAGVYPGCLKNLPFCEMAVQAVNRIENRADRFNIVYPVYSDHQMPTDYTGSFPTNLNVSAIASAPYQDATYMEEKMFGEDYGIARGAPDLPSAEQERTFNEKVQSFAVKLMLAMTAIPSVIVNGTMARKPKEKKGRVISELWNPNLIGWNYRAKRDLSGGEGGTHASPRMHWRRGTYRNQPYGQRPWTETTPKRLIWIEPVLVNAA